MKILLLLIACLLISFSYGMLEIKVKHYPTDCQRRVEKDDVVHLHVTGYLKDGRKFLDSTTRTYTFKTNANQVVKGLNNAVMGMCVGEIRTAKMDSSLGYGSQRRGIISPGSDLYYDFELISIN